EAFLPHCDVYITDWTDARLVPLAVGTFDLDDYIDYLRAMLDHLGPGVHTLGICQPSVPLLAAVGRPSPGSPFRRWISLKKTTPMKSTPTYRGWMRKTSRSRWPTAY